MPFSFVKLGLSFISMSVYAVPLIASDPKVDKFFGRMNEEPSEPRHTSQSKAPSPIEVIESGRVTFFNLLSHANAWMSRAFVPSDTTTSCRELQEETQPLDRVSIVPGRISFVTFVAPPHQHGQLLVVTPVVSERSSITEMFVLLFSAVDS